MVYLLLHISYCSSSHCHSSIITKTIMKSPSRSPKLKRRSTRHVSEITAVASEFGNSAMIINHCTILRLGPRIRSRESCFRIDIHSSEIHRRVGLIANYPCIMSRRDISNVSRSVFFFTSIIHLDSHSS